MPTYKVTAFYRDTVSGFGWSNTFRRVSANLATAVSEFSTWNDAFMTIAGQKTQLDAAVFLDTAPGMFATTYPGASFVNPVGLVHADTFPAAEGLMWEGYGGPVRKGRADWLFHGVAETKKLNTNQWNVLDVDVISFAAACFSYLQQYRKVASPVLGYPAVNPPVAWATGNVNPYIRLRRAGRPFLQGGQGRRTR